MSSPSRGVARALSAVEKAPSSGEAWSQLGTAFLLDGKAASAVEALTRAVALRPELPVAWAHLGLAKRRNGDHLGGLAALERAAALEPHSAAAWGNLSAALESCGHGAAAVSAAQRAVSLDPERAGWHATLGTALRSIGRLDAALDAFEGAAQRSPDDVRIPWNRALTLLSAHNFAEGFPAYEARLQRPQHRALPAPVWTAGPPPVDGVVVHHEQGFGDTLQWARFLPALHSCTGRVVVAAPPKLHALLSTVPGVAATVSREEAREDGALARLGCSAHVGMMSLGALLGETGDTLSVHLPTFHPDAANVDRWRTRLRDGRPLVALAWQGNPSYERDHLRSPPLKAFAPLLDHDGIRFVSLQKYEGVEQLRQGTGPLRRIEDLADTLDPGPDAFVDTAAVMMVADLVITSDTSTAHLAGALGRPTWVLLSTPCDWRWGHHPNRTPWYPSMRLFRQPRPGDWGGLFREVAGALDRGIGDPTA